jgi:serine/threonine-protein kinase
LGLPLGDDGCRGVVNEHLITSSFVERSISLSRDGRFLAYVSNESGQDEVYVRPFPDTGRWRETISINGGSEPVWDHGGTQLFYRDPSTGAMMVATFETEPTFLVSRREELFDSSPYLATNGPWRAYDITKDDERFLMIRSNPAGVDATRLVLVQNFFAEIERLTAN